MKKRILSAFLCLCMMLTLAPAAFASDTGGTEDGTTPPSTGDNNPDMGGGTGEENIFQINIADAELPAGGKVEGLGVNTETENTLTFTGEIPQEYFTEEKPEITFTMEFLKESNTSTVTGKFSLDTDKKNVKVTFVEGTTLPDTYKDYQIVSTITATTSDPGTGGEEKPGTPTDPDTPTDPEPTKVNSLSVSIAPLADTRTEGKLDKLFDDGSYRIEEGTAEGTDNSYKQSIKLFATGLKEHQNGDTKPTMGYWVGFFVKAPTGTTSVKYGKDENPITLTPIETVDNETGLGFFFYCSEIKKLKSYVVVLKSK